MNRDEFQEIVWQHGRELFRPMPWRETTDPYAIMVSELMLQQTQVDRVIPKFTAFLQRFPTVQSLALASQAEVLTLWSGLGYNRRARFLHQAAGMVVNDFQGVMPTSLETLQLLPGIGKNTAAAICAYAYNQPVAFIETNIRTVFFHHFFTNNELVSDKALLPLVADMTDHEHPREWYWALMDYGSWLKKQGLGQIDRSQHYKKQSPLKGSVREVRGAILRALASGPASEEQLTNLVPHDDRFLPALQALEKEGLIQNKKGQYRL